MKQRLERLEELRLELGDIANTFAGNKTGCAAFELHDASGRINEAIRMITEGSTIEDSDRQIAEWCDKQVMPMSPSTVKQIQCLMRK
jgi:hypothetical protein